MELSDIAWLKRKSDLYIVTITTYKCLSKLLYIIFVYVCKYMIIKMYILKDFVWDECSNGYMLLNKQERHLEVERQKL